jgi:5-oxoprolinase (ATP-hydrolysing)
LSRIADGIYEFADVLESPLSEENLELRLRVQKSGGEATFDFTGTSPATRGNLNATPAIVSSAVIYCLRCLVNEEIPLNAGVLAPVRIVIPRGSLLDPPVSDDATRCPAVVGGNVETSQRIVDCILGALGVVAASQGTMNNLAFGTHEWGYYETICGGSGAGPMFDGADAVHTHMTNTRLTDPEVLEARYPVRVRRFEIRRGSRGAGAYRGGDGVVREIEFLEDLEVSMLTQRRVSAPFGLAGGAAGTCGRNVIIRANGGEEFLAAASQIRVSPGDRLRIETPGGGGFGARGQYRS